MLAIGMPIYSPPLNKNPALKVSGVYPYFPSILLRWNRHAK